MEGAVVGSIKLHGLPQPTKQVFDIVPGMSEPTPMAVPEELQGLAEAVPGLIVALREARIAGERAGVLDEREIELVRIGALLAIGAPPGSFDAHVTRALGAGATEQEVWSAVAAVATLVGVPRILETSPHIAAAIAAVM